MKRTVHGQRVEVAKSALARVAASGDVMQGPKPIWVGVVAAAYKEVACGAPILS